MPRYDFRCDACDVVFEVERPMGATGDVTCPTCGDLAKKVFSATGMVLKGSGFHNTDYRPRPSEGASCPAASAG